jgi:hypothetical protein
MVLARIALALVVGAAGAVVNAAPTSASAAGPSTEAAALTGIGTGTGTGTGTDQLAGTPAAPQAGDESWSAADDFAMAAGMTSGYVVFDRANNRYVRVVRSTKQFRSASVVKLLIALDHLWTRDPEGMTARNRGRLSAMLRVSDDDAASYFWGRNGNREIVQRMSRRLNLDNTAPPPARLRGWWGYTAMTAGDTSLVYRYLLTQARPAVRKFIMWRLENAGARGSDGVNQRFGLLAFGRPRAAKQGWSGFGGSPPSVRIKGLDLRSEALHTTGVYGTNNRFIVVIFTLHQRGTRYGTATARVTRLTGAVR